MTTDSADPIVSIAVFHADLPLKEPFRHASSGQIDALKEVVVKVATASGAIGWGEVRGNAPYVTGETQSRLSAAVCGIFAPALIEARLSGRFEIARFLHRLVPGNESGKAVLDIAIHDATARASGLPVKALLGGSRDEIKVHCSIPFCPPDEAARRAARYFERGIRTIKVRTGLPDVADDIARLDAIHEIMVAHPDAEGMRLSIDVNQAWTAKQAIPRLRMMERFDLSWVEQPVPADDIEGLIAVRAVCQAPLIADESCKTPSDLLRLIQSGAADGFHFKLCKAGGIAPLMKMCAIAEAANMPYIVGQMDEGMLATTAAAHCAAAASPFTCELWGFHRVGEQPFSGTELISGGLRLARGAGFGVEVDEPVLQPIAHFGAAFQQ